MADSLSTGAGSLFNNAQPFGLNVKGHSRTLTQFGDTLTNTAGGVLDPLFTYLEENETVFNGDITKELNKLYTAKFNTQILMDKADEQVNGSKPKFDANF